MKKLICAFIIVVVLVGLSGADIRRNSNLSAISIPKKHCVGYTILEFGKAIDCHGDTILLKKIKGGQVQMH